MRLTHWLHVISGVSGAIVFLVSSFYVGASPNPAKAKDYFLLAGSVVVMGGTVYSSRSLND